MMEIKNEDLICFSKGEPPNNKELIERITLGQKKWLEPFYEYYLMNYLPRGGSKVKFLVGDHGTGKTHLLRCVQYMAEDLGYMNLYLSARKIEGKINDILNFYKLISSKIDQEKLIRGLCLKVAKSMGYENDYDGRGALLPLIISSGYNQNDAARLIRDSAYNLLKEYDLSPSFFTFSLLITRDRLIDGEKSKTDIAFKWLKGEKLERHEKMATYLFEKLQRPNARYWLNSLISLLGYSDIKGLVILIDDLEILTEKNEETGRFFYTPNAIKDVYELFRQIIDDAELLNKFLLIISGNKVLIDDEKRGFKNYEALWMRIQSGLIPSGRFNTFSDIVDIDEHLKDMGPDFPYEVSKKIIEILESEGFARNGNKQIPDLSHFSLLKSQVIEVGLRAERNI